MFALDLIWSVCMAPVFWEDACLQQNHLPWILLLQEDDLCYWKVVNSLVRHGSSFGMALQTWICSIEDLLFRMVVENTQTQTCLNFKIQMQWSKCGYCELVTQCKRHGTAMSLLEVSEILDLTKPASSSVLAKRGICLKSSFSWLQNAEKGLFSVLDQYFYERVVKSGQYSVSLPFLVL